MVSFKFIHAADLHLDSPLVGLADRSESHARLIDDASRQAFERMISLAIDEDCRLIVISGDVFDGEWRDYRTGLYFVDRMRGLRERQIQVVMIAGNHDAENRFVGRLEFSDNVKLLSSRRPESFDIPSIGTVVHGRSFPQRDVTENLAKDYPPPVPGRFNIGLLHTACGGREGHQNYAPCTVEQLVNHGYQYWALGHVHLRDILNVDPPVVFPGNLQGRNIRESGPKGVTLVDVRDGIVESIEHRPLDVVRWTQLDVDVTGTETRNQFLSSIRSGLEQAFEAAEGRALAVRIRVAGTTSFHNELVADMAIVREELDTIAIAVGSDVWIEKVVVKTSPPGSSNAVDPTIAGKLKKYVTDLGGDSWLSEQIEARLAEIKVKLPASAHANDLFDELRSSCGDRARVLALALIDKGRV